MLLGAGDQMQDHKNPSTILGTIRKAVKAYVAYVPGAGFLVDRTFDQIDETVDAHAEEANVIIGQAYLDILKIVQHGGNNHESHTTFEIMGVCRRLLEDLRVLGVKAGTPIATQLQLEEHIHSAKTKLSEIVGSLHAKFAAANSTPNAESSQSESTLASLKAGG